MYRHEFSEALITLLFGCDVGAAALAISHVETATNFYTFAWSHAVKTSSLLTNAFVACKPTFPFAVSFALCCSTIKQIASLTSVALTNMASSLRANFILVATVGLVITAPLLLLVGPGPLPIRIISRVAIKKSCRWRRRTWRSTATVHADIYGDLIEGSLGAALQVTVSNKTPIFTAMSA